MTPERWEEVARIFELAADVGAEECSAILARECGDDDELRREVEELLEADAPGDGVAGLVDEAVAELLDASPSPTEDDELAETGLSVGETIDDRYEVRRVLGAGGMGVVVEAHHVGLDERVAIKLLKPEALATERARRRFVREAKASAKIKSPHVVRVRDVGTLPSGAPFMVMDMLRGTDLAEVLKVRGSIPYREACGLIVQACEGLATAHAADVVHRDIKPGNLYLERASHGETVVKLLDFGISKVADDEQDVAITRSRDLVGSPAYMSPEQLRSSKDVDARSDVWSLGVVLFEMLSGVRPFVADTLADLSMMILADPPRRLEGDWPPPLARVVERCLQKRPADRFADVGELALALAPFCSADARQGIRRVVGTLGGELLETADLSVVDAEATVVMSSDTSQPPSSGAGRLLGVAVLVVGAGALAWLAFGRGEEQPSRSVSTAPSAPMKGPAPTARASSTPSEVASAVAPPPTASATAEPRPPVPLGVAPPPKPKPAPSLDPYGTRK